MRYAQKAYLCVDTAPADDYRGFSTSHVPHVRPRRTNATNESAGQWAIVCPSTLAGCGLLLVAVYRSRAIAIARTRARVCFSSARHAHTHTYTQIVIVAPTHSNNFNDCVSVTERIRSLCAVICGRPNRTQLSRCAMRCRYMCVVRDGRSGVQVDK